jgi:hypothetical protein
MIALNKRRKIEEDGENGVMKNLLCTLLSILYGWSNEDIRGGQSV